MVAFKYFALSALLGAAFASPILNKRQTDDTAAVQGQTDQSQAAPENPPSGQDAPVQGDQSQNLRPKSPEKHSCDPFKHWEDWHCVKDYCPSWQHWTPRGCEDNEKKTCDPYWHFDESRHSCVHDYCPSSQHWTDRGCKDNSCDPYWHWSSSKGRCVHDHCDNGWTWTSDRGCVEPKKTGGRNCGQTADYCYSKSLEYDPNTQCCYNPARHPSAENCRKTDKPYYDAHRNICTKSPNF